MSLEKIENAFTGFKKVCSNHKDQIATYQAIIEHLKELDSHYSQKYKFNTIRSSCDQKSKKECHLVHYHGFIPIREFLDKYVFVSDSAIQGLCSEHENDHEVVAAKIGFKWYIHPEKMLKVMLKKTRFKNRYEQGILLKAKGVELLNERKS